MFVLVGGPLSLLYLWPMLSDPDQRPSAAEFAGAEGFPFTARDVLLAAVAGAVGIGGFGAVGAPFDVIYWIVLGTVFSPIVVALLATQ